MDATTNEAVCLRCHIGGTPDITVSWFKADGKLRSTNACKMDYSNGIATLRLSNVVKSDQGEYNCKAENRTGFASSSCQLTVKGDSPAIFASFYPHTCYLWQQIQICILFKYSILDFQTSPYFPNKCTHLQLAVGMPVKFECQVIGSSPLEVSWLKDGGSLTNNGQYSTSYDDNTAVLKMTHGKSNTPV